MTPAEEKRIVAAVIAGIEPRLHRMERLLGRLDEQIGDQDRMSDFRWEILMESLGTLRFRTDAILDEVQPGSQRPRPSFMDPPLTPLQAPWRTGVAGPAPGTGASTALPDDAVSTRGSDRVSKKAAPSRPSPASASKPDHAQSAATSDCLTPSSTGDTSGRGQGKATVMGRTGVAIGVTPETDDTLPPGSVPDKIPEISIPTYVSGALALEKNPSTVLGLSAMRQMQGGFEPDGEILVQGKVEKVPLLVWVSMAVNQSVWSDLAWFTNMKPASRTVRVPGQGTVQATGVGQVDIQIRQGTASRPAWTTIRLDNVLFCPRLDNSEYTGIISFPPFINGGKASVEIDQKAMLTLASGKTVGMSVLAPSGVNNKDALQLEKLRTRVRAPRYKEGLVRFDNLAAYPIFHDKSLFEDLKPCNESVRQSSMGSYQARGKGTVRLQVWTGLKTGWKEFTFPEARWCPDYNLRGEGPNPPSPDGVIYGVSIAGPGQTKAMGSVGVDHGFGMPVELANRSIFLGSNRKYTIGVLNEAGFVFQGRVNPPSSSNEQASARSNASSHTSSSNTMRGGSSNQSNRRSPTNTAPRSSGTIPTAPTASAGRPRWGFRSPMTKLTRPVLWKPQQDGGKHIFSDLALFNPSTIKWERRTVKCEGRIYTASAYGSIDMEVNTPELGWVKLPLQDVLYVPSWVANIQTNDRSSLPVSHREDRFAGVISTQALCEPADGPYRYVSFAVDQNPLQLTLSNDLEFDNEITVATFRVSGFVAEATFLVPTVPTFEDV